MNTHNAAVALLSENLSQVLVRFKWSNGELSPKLYSYVSTIELQPGDEAIVNSPFGGYKVVVVEKVLAVTVDVEADFDYKFIVQRVDKEADEQRQQLIEELKFAINEKQRQQALANVKKALGIKKGGKLSQAIEVLRKNLV